MKNSKVIKIMKSFEDELPFHQLDFSEVSYVKVFMRGKLISMIWYEDVRGFRNYDQYLIMIKTIWGHVLLTKSAHIITTVVNNEESPI